MAFKAACAHSNGNIKKTYEIVSELRGYMKKPMKQVKLLSGKLSTSEEERQARWEQHFAELFGGQVTKDFSACSKSSCSAVQPYVHIGLRETDSSITCLGNDRAVGPDEIGADLLKAGGFAVVHNVNVFHNRAIKEERAPIAWKGGRIVDLWKRKKDATECSSSRGLLISDHLAKTYTGVLVARAMPCLRPLIPEEQFGGFKGGGTDFANLSVRCLLQFAALAGLSVFALFLDLEKAFDKVIRELVFDKPHWCAEPVEKYLQSIGLSAKLSEDIAAHLHQEGCVFDEAGVEPSITRAINVLHSGTWFKYGNRDSVITSTFGGRQGCKLGGIIFSVAYMRALRRLRAALTSKGIALKVRFDVNRPFWSDIAGEVVASDESMSFAGGWSNLTTGASDGAMATEDDDVHECVEATFVDDEALVLMATSPARLDECIHFVLSELVIIFQQFGLIINWAPGKTECMLAYRGKHASRALEARRTQTGNIAIRIPGTKDNPSPGLLQVVSVFKHLGGHVTVNGGLGPELSYRSSSAMQSYVPLAGRVFGSPAIGVHIKHAFAASLILPRLFFNAHTWTVKDNSLAKLNGTYMRVYRRIHGHCRFAAEDNITDVAVRHLGNIPSID